MESEAHEKADNAGQHISTCSAAGDLTEGAFNVSECISNGNLTESVNTNCEIKKSVTLPSEDFNSLDGASKFRDGESLKEHLEGNRIHNVSSASVEYQSRPLSDGDESCNKTESAVSLPTIDQKAVPENIMNLAEKTNCNNECESLVQSVTGNTYFQSSPSKPLVNILSLDKPIEDIKIVSLVVTDVGNGSKELVCSVSNNDTHNFRTSLSPKDAIVSSNLMDLSCEEQDENISDDVKPIDQNSKVHINLENVNDNVIENVFIGSSLENSSFPTKNEKCASLLPNDGAKNCDSISIRNGIVESQAVSHSEINEGEKCDSDVVKPFDICRNDNPQFHNCNIDADCGSDQSESQICNQINCVVTGDVSGAFVSDLASKDSGVCLISNENVQSFAGISGSNEVTTVAPSEGCKELLNYRGSSDSSSESELVSSSDDESVTEIADVDGAIRKHGRRPEPVCHGEILLTDLPPIEDLNISVPEEECIKIGEISSIVGEQVVVQALPNTPALDLESVLFFDHGKTALGKIFDVLGPVKEPFYTVRFNSEDHARERGVTVGADVFCAPRTNHTTYIFLAQMMKMKGSDASWEHNHEPPPVCLDYSDDEEERLARRASTHQRYGDDRDGGPPRKRRGSRHRMGNSNQLNGGNQRGNFVDSPRPDVSPVRGYFPQSLPHATPYSPLLPHHPVYPSVAQGVPGGYAGRFNSPHLILSGPPPNFRPPMRTGFNNPLFEAPLRNFAQSASPSLPPNLPPSMNSPPPYFIRPFHMLPSVPLVPLPHPPLPPYLSSPHVRPLLCPPRFRPPMDDNRGPGNF